MSIYLFIYLYKHMTEVHSNCTLDKLSAFGEFKFQGITANKADFINVLSNEDPFEKFRHYCALIMGRQYEKINLNVFNNTVYTVVNADPLRTSNVIFNVLNSATNDFSDWIQTEIEDETFSIRSFIAKYKEYYSRTQQLARSLWYYEHRVQSNNTNRKHSQVNLIRSYLFYANVINKQYNIFDSDMYLYKIFSLFMNATNTTIDDILPLFRMYQFYVRLSFVPPEDLRSDLFNLALDIDFMTSMGCNAAFVKTLIERIHNSLRVIGETTDNHKKEINDIKGIIKMGTNFDERDMFNLYYQRFLENRLLSGTVNVSLERELLHEFKTPEDNRIVKTMLHQIEDIERSITDKQTYNTLSVKITSDENKNVNINELKREMVNIKTLRHFAWSESKRTEFTAYRVPAALRPYVAIYVSFYKTKYPHRTLTWDFNLGTAIYKLTINNDTYMIKMTLPQLFVLIQFNDKPKLTAIELSERVGLPCSKIGEILNVFLTTQILNRDINVANNDPNMRFFYNRQFSHPNKNFSLVSFAKVRPEEVNDQEVVDKFAIGRHNILLAKVVRLMKQHKTLSHNDLKSKSQDGLLFEFDANMFADVINDAKNQYYIEEQSGNSVTYHYKTSVGENDPDDIDSEDEYSDEEIF